MGSELHSTRLAEVCGLDPLKLRPRFSATELRDTARAIALGPQGCWTILKYDSKTSREVFEHYVFVLAAIPCVCGFIGHGLFGNLTISLALTRAFIGYFLCLVFFFSAVFLARKSAPMFDGEISNERAAKLVVYSLSPFFACGVLLLLPALSPLILCGTVSVFYFLRGIRDMSRVPIRKQLTYGILNVVCWIVVADLFVRICFA